MGYHEQKGNAKKLLGPVGDSNFKWVFEWYVEIPLEEMNFWSVVFQSKSLVEEKPSRI